MILRIHIDVQKVERLGARLSCRSSLGRFGEISTAPQPRSRIPSLCKSAKRPTRRSSAPTGERALSASRASPDGSVQPITIPDPASCGLVRPATRFVKVDKAVTRFVEEPRSQHPGRELWIRRGIGPQFWNIRFLVATCRVLYAASHRFGSVIFHFSRSSPYSHSVWGNGCATLEQETLSLAGSAAGQYFVARGSVLTLRLTRLESSRDGGAPGAAAGAADDRLHDQSYQRRCQPEN